MSCKTEHVIFNLVLKEAQLTARQWSKSMKCIVLCSAWPASHLHKLITNAPTTSHLVYLDGDAWN